MKGINSGVAILGRGKGDAYLIKTKDYEQFVFDCGSGEVDVFSQFAGKFHLILSHVHDLHIGGLQFLTERDYQRMVSFSLPYWQSELTIIAEWLLNLTPLLTDNKFASALGPLKQFLAYRALAIKMAKERKMYFIGDGDRFSSSMWIYNPSKEITREGGLKKDQLERWFDQDFMEREYKTLNEVISGRQAPRVARLYNQKIRPKDSLHFIEDFFIKQEEAIDKFVAKPTMRGLDTILRRYYHLIDECSLVVHYREKDHSILLTGDVTSDVLARISEVHQVETEYLVMPQHGNKKHVSESVIKAFNPKRVIVNHSNRRIGLSKDTTPNNEVIAMLDKLKIPTYYTNPVEKNGMMIREANMDQLEDAFVHFL